MFFSASSRSLRASTTLAVLAVLACGTAGCDEPPAERPDAAAEVDAWRPDAGPPRPDGAVPCDDDEDCDDRIPCTRDVCDAIGFCRQSPDPAMCDDGVFCNGVEVCDLRNGCSPGARITCNDGDVCTIDRCNEETDSCDHFPRDLDEDGDPDFFCDGNDCDDRDPTRSSRAAEICDDGADNDCDDLVDESTCGRPPYDICDEPLDVSAGGSFVVDLRGMMPDYALGCVGLARPDAVLRLTLTETRDVRIEARGDRFATALALRTSCADRATELECSTGFPGAIRRRSLAPGTYFVIVTGVTGGGPLGEVEVVVQLTTPSPPPTHENCSMPQDVSAGGTFSGSMLDVMDDLTTGCGFLGSPDLVYTFTTTRTHDVRISAVATTGGSMAWEVRPVCGSSAGAVRCAFGSPASGRIHELPAGTYFLILEGPSFSEVDFTLSVEFLDPTPPLRGDQCTDPIPLTLGVRTPGSLAEMEDDYATSCGYYYRESVYTFTLPERRDVAISVDGGSTFMNASLRTTCADSATQIRCTAGRPVAMRVRDLPGGTYYLLVEAPTAASFHVTVTDSAPVMPVPVSGNETCATAFVIPATGGLFTGDTTGMMDDLRSATCGGMARSPDAVFRIDLPARRRVVASTAGSSYDTVLHIHADACRDGGDIACDDDGGEGVTSLLDRTLAAGTYYIVVDGFGMGSRGPYVLEVTVSDP
jgi:hypothetical protein